jgi:hypothetical protein
VVNGAAPVRDAKGRLVGGAISVQDITSLKTAQEQLTYQARLLARVQEAILATDAQVRVTYQNPGFGGRPFHTRESVFLPGLSAEDLRRLALPSTQPFLDQESVAGLIVVPVMTQTDVIGTLATYRLTSTRPKT